jgi:tetratricopeptide (TPR) repeat protein
VFICTFIGFVAFGSFCVIRYYSSDGGRADNGKQPEIVAKRSRTQSGLPMTLEQEIAALKKEETELMKAVMMDFPNDVVALEQMGNFLSRHGQRIEAVVFWKKCLAMDPDYFNAHRKLGMVALDKGECEQALEYYRSAARIRPEAEGIHVKMGEALVGLGQYDDAIREVQEEIRIRPETAMAHFLLGQAYLKQKAYEKAKSHYEKALELNPEYANAYYGLVRVFVGLKQPDKAGEYQAKFRSFRAEDAQIAYDDREMGTADYLASSRTSVVQALLDAEKLYRGRKDFSRCEALVQRAVALDPNSPECFERLGLLYSITNRLAEAVRQFERMSEIQPNNPRCYLNIGNISTRMGRFHQAEWAFQKVTIVAPREPLGYRKLCQLYLNTKTKLAKARMLAQKAVDLNASAENLFLLGWACDVNGDRAEAVKMIERAIRLDPNNFRYRQVYERIKRGY